MLENQEAPVLKQTNKQYQPSDAGLKELLPDPGLEQLLTLSDLRSKPEFASRVLECVKTILSSSGQSQVKFTCANILFSSSSVRFCVKESVRQIWSEWSCVMLQAIPEVETRS